MWASISSLTTYNERWSSDKEEQRFDSLSGYKLLKNNFTSSSAMQNYIVLNKGLHWREVYCRGTYCDVHFMERSLLLTNFIVSHPLYVQQRQCLPEWITISFQLSVISEMKYAAYEYECKLRWYNYLIKNTKNTKKHTSEGRGRVIIILMLRKTECYHPYIKQVRLSCYHPYVTYGLVLSSLYQVRLSGYHPYVTYGLVLSSLYHVRLSGYHPYVTYGWVLSSLRYVRLSGYHPTAYVTYGCVVYHPTASVMLSSLRYVRMYHPSASVT